MNINEKKCTRCQQPKPLDDFAKDNRRPTKRSDYCRPCKKLIGIKHEYGIEPEQYVDMVIAQGGKCKTCDSPAADIDHCHATGVIRGMLCRSCNLVLGHVKDSPTHLRALALYLEATEVDGYALSNVETMRLTRCVWVDDG